MKSLGLAFFLFAASIAAQGQQITNFPSSLSVSMNPSNQGKILGPVTSAQFAAANGFGTAIVTNVGVVVTNIAGNSNFLTGALVGTNLTLTNTYNTNASGGGTNIIVASNNVVVTTNGPTNVVGITNSPSFTGTLSASNSILTNVTVTSNLTVGGSISGGAISGATITANSSTIFGQTNNSISFSYLLPNQMTVQSDSGGGLDFIANPSTTVGHLDAFGDFTITGQFNGSAAGLTGTLPPAVIPSYVVTNGQTSTVTLNTSLNVNGDSTMSTNVIVGGNLTVTNNISSATAQSYISESTNMLPITLTTWPYFTNIVGYGASEWWGFGSQTPVQPTSTNIAGVYYQLSNDFGVSLNNLATPGYNIVQLMGNSYVNRPGWPTNQLIISPGDLNDINGNTTHLSTDPIPYAGLQGVHLFCEAWTLFSGADQHPLATDLVPAGNPYGHTNGLWTNTPQGLNPGIGYYWENYVPGLFSANVGDSLTFSSLPGKSLIVLYDGFFQNVSNGGTFSITIDGTNWGNVNNYFSTWNYNWAQGPDNTNVPQALIISNLANITHTVVISNIQGNVAIDGVWAPAKQTGHNPMYIPNVYNPQYASGQFGGLLSKVLIYNQMILSNVLIWDSIGEPVKYVDNYSSFYGSSNLFDIFDNTHPNLGGGLTMAGNLDAAITGSGAHWAQYLASGNVINSYLVPGPMPYTNVAFLNSNNVFTANTNSFSGNINITSNITFGWGGLLGNNNGVIILDQGPPALASVGANTVLIGSGAGAVGPAGNNDVYIGDAAGIFNSSAHNVFIGAQAAEGNGQYNNVAIGFQSMIHNTGQGNTVVGADTAASLTSGSFNIDIQAGLPNGGDNNLVAGTNNIYLGSSGAADENNTVRIGTNGQTGYILTSSIGGTGQTNAQGFYGPLQISGSGVTVTGSGASTAYTISGGGGGGAQTPWTNNENANGNYLSNFTGLYGVGGLSGVVYSNTITVSGGSWWNFVNINSVLTWLNKMTPTNAGFYSFPIANWAWTVDTNGTSYQQGIANTLAFAGSLSNATAPASIVFPGSGTNYTNPFTYDIEVYINNNGITGTSISKNGGVIFSSLSADCTVGLKPGETFSEAYSVGTPSAKISPYP